MSAIAFEGCKTLESLPLQTALFLIVIILRDTLLQTFAEG
jgi:hypothetical protein